LMGHTHGQRYRLIRRRGGRGIRDILMRAPS
jgi:hypothetical protein